MDYIDDPSGFTQNIVAMLIEDGSDTEAVYTIEHHFSSTNFDKLEKAAVAAFKLNYDVTDAEEFETDDGQEILAFDVIAESKLDVAKIQNQVEQMEKLAADYQVEYDGWGTEFIEPQQQ
ncbi:RNase E inhibitor protein [Catenovulum agarivorans DS-2]|uniref:RNase E inhibitor protein n=1 Tax=Catenovulum agarivorans DS-2 TaxID=1328313 RepID=W7QLC0_9ALTE|nr:ribonuclease E inhibitor RraB [Catenovulum agarivorans]EWH09722.1 RNase E inhibitor protein [Catenovulum agarivorans DS-2]